MGKLPKAGGVYNGQMEEKAKAGEGALGTALSRQCSPKLALNGEVSPPGGWDSRLILPSSASKLGIIQLL